MTALSNHVPDPRLVTAYAERRDGPLHRVNPWTKVAIAGALVLAVTVVDDLGVLAAVYASTLVVYGVAGFTYRRLLGWYSLPALFVVSVGVPIAFLEPGTPVGGVIATPVGELSVTIEGLTVLAELATRSLTVVTFALTAAMTTPYASVAHVLGRLLPRPIDQVALLAYRFSFLMLETIEELVAAARARGATFDSFWSNPRLYARIFGMTFLAGIERAETLVAAMEARGYDGDLVAWADVGRPPPVELAGITLAYGLVAAYAFVAADGLGVASAFVDVAALASSTGVVR